MTEKADFENKLKIDSRFSDIVFLKCGFYGLGSSQRPSASLGVKPKKYFSVVQQNTYKRKAAEFSMLARRFVPGDKTKKPGPGTHWPEAVKIHKPSVPKYSMGVRHSEYITPLIENSSEI